ncbi:hypothetical protein BS47DRAFT_1327877 [Hydnum rufescens UP504]|uniref:Endonuclease/exonuclease/phosphatase domain-containing protein n=1 Tax=Hydnum rufescens UP504 TaxID=1448309 RepID=A0A9P6B1F4_9AGAM|nr:hypothetical protein BS47DRAFT_1327877 [Hydnum rufescens UP504]
MASIEDEDQIRVLSFNCWGLKYVARNRVERLRAIADKLSTAPYDVICLQELWVSADYQLLHLKLTPSLPFAKFFYTGALGSGLAIFSRYPILGTRTHTYSLNGPPINVAAGDWIVGKGAVSVLLSHPILHRVEVFNTHMVAYGGDDGPEVQRAHRIVGAWELARLIRDSAALGRYVIAVGDFNSVPSSVVMSIIRDHAGLSDAWMASHDTGHLPTTELVQSPHHALLHFGVTADSPLNTYTAGKRLETTARRGLGKRLDYIFYRGPSPRPPLNGNEHQPVLSCTESQVAMTGRIPGHDISFSDHFGIEATLRIRTAPTPTLSTPLPAAPSVWDTEPSTPTTINTHSGPSSAHITDQTLSTIRQILVSAYRIARFRARQQLTVFALCLTADILLFLVSIWQPLRVANPAFVFCAAVLTWLGTTMLYSGFIYGRWEANALMTVIEELELFSRYPPSDDDRHGGVLGQGARYAGT